MTAAAAGAEIPREGFGIATTPAPKALTSP